MPRVVGVKPVGRVFLHICGDIRLNTGRRPKVQNRQRKILGNAFYHCDVIGKDVFTVGAHGDKVFAVAVNGRNDNDLRFGASRLYIDYQRKQRAVKSISYYANKIDQQEKDIRYPCPDDRMSVIISLYRPFSYG